MESMIRRQMTACLTAGLTWSDLRVGKPVTAAGRLMLWVLVVALSASLATADESMERDAVEVVRSGRAVATVINRDLSSLPVIDRARPIPGNAPARDRRDRGPTAEQGWRKDVQDPLAEAQQAAAAKATRVWTVDLNVAGIGFSGTTPADPVGDVGDEYFVQMVNAPTGSVFAVFDTSSGSMVAGPSAIENLWQGSGPCAEGWGHPGVVYDTLAQRWVLSELGAGNHLCVYVSQTDDPIAGGWFAYDFEFPKFPDAARIGVWADGYYVASNEDLPAVYALERDAMIDGSAAGWQRFTAPALDGFGFNTLTPVDLDGVNLPDPAAGGIFVRHADGQLHGGVDRIELFELDVDWASPGNSALSGPLMFATAAFDSALCGTAGGCVPQPGTSVVLDPGREVGSSLVRYRRFASYESLVGSFVVDTNASNHAGLRWFELRRSGGSWSLHQEGTYSPDDLHRWIGGMAMDRDGNLALAFNVSNASSIYPSIRATGREAADPLGVMTLAETELRGGTSAQLHGHSPELWGASTSVAVSPVDDCTIWATAAFGENDGWGTSIASFRFPSCDGGGSDLIFADDLESGDLSNWSSVFP
jgi:hypothetical protein